jgi:diguanylate cyclase (GGDEF)-like protein/PAS domain S-box-containing protein
MTRPRTGTRTPDIAVTDGSEARTSLPQALIVEPLSSPTYWQKGTALLAALVVTALAFLASRGLRAMTGQVAPMWLSNAVLLAQMIVTRREQRRWVLCGGTLGDFTANLLIGRSLHTSVSFTSADMLQVVIAFAFAPRVTTVAEFIRPKALLKFLFGGVLLASVASGMWATLLLEGKIGHLLLPTLAPWFISDGLSLIIITPVAMVFWSGELARVLRSGNRFKTCALVALVGVVTSCIFGLQISAPLLYWVLPPIVLLAFQAEIAGVLLGLLLCLAIALWFTAHGSGPLWAYPFEGMQHRVFALQLFFVAALGVALPISAIQMQRNRMIGLLRDGEKRFRTLAENATDVVMSMQLDGRLTYVSPRAFEAWGRAPEQLIGVHYADLVDAADRNTLAAMIEQVATGRGEASQISRFPRDGGLRWIETHVRPVIDPLSGTLNGLTAMARDVTEQKAIEQRHADERRELEGLAFRDSLTGLFNRRYFDRELKQRCQQGSHTEAYLAVVMIDVDNYKSYNDHFGHQTGDECLRTIARSIAASSAKYPDLVARYGGEEFALILAHAEPDRALAVAEQIREDVEKLRLPHPPSVSGVVTISLGVCAQRSDKCGDGSTVVAAADMALYSAKRLGRNRTCVA